VCIDVHTFHALHMLHVHLDFEVHPQYV